MSTNTPIALSGLARRLVRDGLLGENSAQEAYQAAAKSKQPFVSYLVKNNLAPSMAIAEAASDEFGAPLFDLSAFNVALAPKDLVDPKLAQQHHALPLYKRGNRLFLAVSDPTNLRAIDEIKFHTGASTEAILVEERLLADAIAKYVEASDRPLGDLGDLDDAVVGGR